MKPTLASLLARLEVLEAQVAELKAPKAPKALHGDDDIVIVTCAKCKRKGPKTFAEAKGWTLCLTCAKK